MKKTIVATSLFAALAASAMGVNCQVMAPNPEALAARIAAAEAQPPMMKAAVKAETRLNVIDILVAFDKSASDWLAANGKGTPAEYANGCIVKMNYCLKHSRLDDMFQFRLAGTVEVGVDASQMPLGDVVLNLVNEYGTVVAKDEWKKITDAREFTGADIVSVLTASGAQGNVGYGFSLEGSPYATNASAIKSFGDWAYNACAIEAVDVDYTMMHEVAHNMGCGHPDVSVGPGLAQFTGMPGPQLYDYSAGWYVWNEGVGYYTVMAYNFGGIGPNGETSGSYGFNPLPVFSTPEFLYDGMVVGDARHDNRRTLLNTYKQVAQYRISKVPEPIIDPDPDELQSLDPQMPDCEGEITVVKPAEIVEGLSLAKAAEVGGCVLDATGRPVAAVSLKFGKTGKTGTKVSGSVTPFDTGKKQTLANHTANLSARPKTVQFTVKGMGMMELKLGRNAAGQVVYCGNFDGKAVSSAVMGDATVTGEKSFSKPAVPESVNGVEVNPDYLPDGEKVFMQGKKWTLAKATSIAYKKDKVTGEMRWVENNGKNDPAKTNRSGLKLTYKAKDGSFKGSFTIYGLQGGKLKKVKADVRGLVVEGRGYGVAKVKTLAEAWPITVK